MWHFQAPAFIGMVIHSIHGALYLLVCDVWFGKVYLAYEEVSMEILCKLCQIKQAIQRLRSDSVF